MPDRAWGRRWSPRSLQNWWRGSTPPEVLAGAFVDNDASRKILKNLGFRRGEDLELQSLGRASPAPAALYRWRPGLLG